MADAIYLDSSALVRWIIREPGWEALGSYLADRPVRVASRLVDVEVPRALTRALLGSPAPLREQVDARMHAALEGVARIEVDEGIAAAAARVAPVSLRALDALHLCSAMVLGEQLEALVTYDERLAAAARGVGLGVAAPGA